LLHGETGVSVEDFDFAAAANGGVNVIKDEESVLALPGGGGSDFGEDDW